MVIISGLLVSIPNIGAEGPREELWRDLLLYGDFPSFFFTRSLKNEQPPTSAPITSHWLAGFSPSQSIWEPARWGCQEAHPGWAEGFDQVNTIWKGQGAWKQNCKWSHVCFLADYSSGMDQRRGTSREGLPVLWTRCSYSLASMFGGVFQVKVH